MLLKKPAVLWIFYTHSFYILLHKIKNFLSLDFYLEYQVNFVV